MHQYCQDRFLDSIDLLTQHLGVYQLLLWTQLFSRRPLDVTDPWPEVCAFSQKEPTCQHVFAWTLNCVYLCITTEFVAIACIDEELLVVLNVLTMHWTDYTESWTIWTALTLLPEYRLYDVSQRLSWCYRINESTLLYFGNTLYLLSLAFSVILNLSVTAASKSNYTIVTKRKRRLGPYGVCHFCSSASRYTRG